MQPSPGSSGGLAKADSQRSNTEDTKKGRNDRRDAKSAEKTVAGTACAGLEPLLEFDDY